VHRRVEASAHNVSTLGLQLLPGCPGWQGGLRASGRGLLLEAGRPALHLQHSASRHSAGLRAALGTDEQWAVAEQAAWAAWAHTLQGLPPNAR
jgi:hypothetical protein